MTKLDFGRENKLLAQELKKLPPKVRRLLNSYVRHQKVKWYLRDGKVVVKFKKNF